MPKPRAFGIKAPKQSGPVYKRAIVKLSGEAFGGPQGSGFDQATVEKIAKDLVATAKMGVELGVVVGGGNIFRGVEVSERGVPRAVGDTMGMLATVMNCLVLEAAIERQGREARTLSALAMTSVCETYNRKRAMKNLAKGRVVLLAAGTGNPFFTTDTTAVLRAAELECEAVLKATNVDGVYTADPKKDPKAKRYDKLSHQEAIEKHLRVMDSTAFALARENHMPIIVFSIADKGAIEAVLRGKGRSTVIG
jgi:uridylate kinase